MKIKTVRYISNMDDITLMKKQLSKKIKRQEIIIKEGLLNLKEKSSPQNIYNEILEEFKLENSLFTLLPLALKYKQLIIDKVSNISPKYRKAIYVIGGGLIAGLVSFWIYKRKTNSNSNQEDEQENSTE